ncbi:15376_t:CDS:2, partial [Funneliformis mosseae]
LLYIQIVLHKHFHMDETMLSYTASFNSSDELHKNFVKEERSIKVSIKTFLKPCRYI